jgi:hypothetical protein
VLRVGGMIDRGTGVRDCPPDPSDPDRVLMDQLFLAKKGNEIPKLSHLTSDEHVFRPKHFVAYLSTGNKVQAYFGGVHAHPELSGSCVHDCRAALRLYYKYERKLVSLQSNHS